MKKLVQLLLAAAILVGAANWGLAQSEPKPLVTVSFSGYNKLLSNVGMIGKLGGRPDLDKMLEVVVTMMTQGKGLVGLDKKQPWGAVLVPDEQQTFAVYGFLPVADLKQLMELAKSNPQLGKIEVNDGVYEIPTGLMSVFVKQKGNWAVIARSTDDFAHAPADPAKLFGDLPSTYDLAVRLSVKEIPPPFRAYALAAMQAGVQAGLERLPNEGSDDHALRANMVQQGMQQMTTLLNELNTLTIGWNVDHATKSTYLDVEAVALPNTKLAKQFADVQPGKTAFAGFLSPKTAVSGTWVNKLDDADVAQAKMGLAEVRKRITSELAKQSLPEEQSKLAKQLLGDALAILEKTVEAKKLDGGLMLDLAPGAATFLIGNTLVDGAKLDKILKQLVDELKKDQPVVDEMIKLNAETYQGVRFHTLNVPSPDPNLTKLVGDTVEAVLGVGDDKVLLAVGRDAAKKLKGVLDRSKANPDKEVLPMQITLAGEPIAKFVAAVAEEDNVKARAAKLAGALEKADGKDHVILTTKPVPNGFRMRLEAEEGLLKLLGSQVPFGAAPGPMPPAEQ